MLTDFLWEEVRCLEKFVADFLLLVVERYLVLRAYNLRMVTNNLLASSHGGCLKMWLETVSEDLSDASFYDAFQVHNAFFTRLYPIMDQIGHTEIVSFIVGG